MLAVHPSNQQPVSISWSLRPSNSRDMGLYRHLQAAGTHCSGAGASKPDELWLSGDPRTSGWWVIMLMTVVMTPHQQ